MQPTLITDEDYRAITEFYGGLSPVEAPLYSYAAASRYLKLPYSTVRWWALGRTGTNYQPVLGRKASSLLTFSDLAELFVIKQLRRHHGVSLESIRRAVAYAEDNRIHRVLLSPELASFGPDIFLSGQSESVAISRSGQLALHELVREAMNRIERSDQFGPVRLYPDFAGMELSQDRHPIAVSPLVAFGQPTLMGTGIKTAVVSARLDAGEAVDELALDYDIPPSLVMSAALYENAV